MDNYRRKELIKELKEMNYFYMAIELTDCCDINCQFCCNIKNYEKQKKVLSAQGLNTLLSTYKNLEFEGIGFTGGECTLYPHWDLLKDIVTKKNIKYSLITNGYWAKDFLTTYTKLKELKNSNLISMTVSYDDYHKEFVEEKKLKEIIKCTYLLNIPLEIQSVTFTDTQIDWLNDLLKEGYDLRVTFFPGYKIGGAKRFNDSKFIRKQFSNSQFCGKNKTLFFDCSGNCYPCCSPFIEETELKVGNIFLNSIEDIVNTLRSNPILYIIRNYGFDPFLKYCEQIQLKYPTQIANGCELCGFLFSKENYFRFIQYAKERVKREKYETAEFAETNHYRE